MSEVTYNTPQVNDQKPAVGAAVVFKREKTLRIGQVLKAGKTDTSLDVLGMKSNTKLPSTTPLYKLEVLVSAEVLTELGLEVPTASATPEPGVVIPQASSTVTADPEAAAEAGLVPVDTSPTVDMSQPSGFVDAAEVVTPSGDTADVATAVVTPLL